MQTNLPTWPTQAPRRRPCGATPGTSCSESASSRAMRARPAGVTVSPAKSGTTADRSRTRPCASSKPGFSMPLGPERRSFTAGFLVGWFGSIVWGSIVQNGGDLGVVDIVLVVPVKAGVDHLGQLLALERLDGGLHGLVADAHRILRDCAGHHAGPDRILLLLARVVADDHQLALHLFDAVDLAHGRAFIGAEDALQIRVGLQDGLGDFGGLEVVAAAVLDADDLDARVAGLDALDEAVTAVYAGAIGLVMHDQRDLAALADQLGHFVCRQCGRSPVVGARRGHRDVTVYTGVEGHDQHLGGLGLFEQRDHGLFVERCQTDRFRVLGQNGGQHVDLLVYHRFRLWPLERDFDIEVLARLLRPGLHGLPELVLKALGHQRYVDLLGAGGQARAQRNANAQGDAP